MLSDHVPILVGNAALYLSCAGAEWLLTGGYGPNQRLRRPVQGGRGGRGTQRAAGRLREGYWGMSDIIQALLRLRLVYAPSLSPHTALSHNPLRPSAPVSSWPVSCRLINASGAAICLSFIPKARPKSTGEIARVIASNLSKWGRIYQKMEPKVTSNGRLLVI